MAVQFPPNLPEEGYVVAEGEEVMPNDA